MLLKAKSGSSCWLVRLGLQGDKAAYLRHKAQVSGNAGNSKCFMGFLANQPSARILTDDDKLMSPMSAPTMGMSVGKA